MSKNLLDLSDELLLRIAAFTHKDTFVALPSFNPHWQNFCDELDEDVVKDYNSFRATCVRINGLCPVRGLHVHINRTEQITHMMLNVPDSVLKGIKRLRIAISPKPRKNILEAWSTLTAFLHRLPKLEELFIQNHTFCQHAEYFGPKDILSHQLKIPTDDFLPALKSLSICLACDPCRSIVPQLVIPAAPRLEHLRLAINNSSEASKGPVQLLKCISDAIAERQAGSTLKLRSLYLRIQSSDAGMLPILRQVSLVFPHLEDLRITPYTSRQSMVSGPSMVLPKTVPEDGVEFEDPAECGLFEPLSIFTDRLTGFDHLKYIDCVMSISITGQQRRPTEYLPTYGQSRTDFLRAQMSAQKALAKTGQHNEDIRQAILTVVDWFIEAVPTLTSGSFWEHVRSKRKVHSQDWFRWTWKVEDNGNGQKKVTVSATAERYSPGFVTSTEGVTIKRQGVDYVSDVEESETDFSDDD